jgi:hypothetical protein
MMHQERLRRVQRCLRETHRTMFDLQGEAIAGLRVAIDAVSRTHDEMMVLFESDDQLEDLADGIDPGGA